MFVLYNVYLCIWILVTRSLRKRLTSVDSDAANRPETPNQISKLQSISELGNYEK